MSIWYATTSIEQQLLLYSLCQPRLCQQPDSFSDLFFWKCRITKDHRRRVICLIYTVFGQRVDLDARLSGSSNQFLLRQMTIHLQQNVNSWMISQHLSYTTHFPDLTHEHVMLTLIESAHLIQMPLIISLFHKKLQNPLIQSGYGTGKYIVDPSVGLQKALRQHQITDTAGAMDLEKVPR